MTRNAGTTDRIVRGAIGLALIVAALAGWFPAAALFWLALAVGAVLLLTAASGRCPAYSVFGISTCRA